jgi:dTMP kinase
MLKKPLFITFEGIDYSGKSTQVKNLHSFFLQHNLPCTTTKEPGGCDAGNEIREVLLKNRSTPLQKETQLLLNFASRFEHIQNTISPNLKQNISVISDRFIHSTYVYQGFAMGINLELIDFFCQQFVSIKPDITFFLDISPETALQRSKNRPQQQNYYDKMPSDFWQKARNGFLDLAKQNSTIKIIDGNQNETQVFQQIIPFLLHNALFRQNIFVNKI